MKQAGTTAVWWHYRNSARYNKKFCRRENTAGRCTEFFIHIFKFRVIVLTKTAVKP